MKKLIIAIFLLLTTISYGQRSVGGSTVNITPNYDHYYLSGAITKIDPTDGVDGFYTFTATDTVTFTEYDSGSNTGSNFAFSDTILPGESVQLYFDGTTVRSSSTTVETNDFIRTSTGAACSDDWGDLTSSQTNPIEQYSMVVTAGAVTLTDIGNGILSGSGGTGWVDYFRNMIVLCFDVAPTAGTTIEADYRYHTGVHQIGMWYKIN